MKILYGVLSQGQGHINRAAQMLRRLEARGHRVEVVLSGDRPPAYAERELPRHTWLPVTNFVLESGVVHRRRSISAFLGTVPARTIFVRDLRRRLAKERFDLVLTDFEPLSAWAAWLSKVPVAGIAGQYRITRTDALQPARGTGAVVERALAHAVIDAWTPPLSRYFAVSYALDRPTRARTDVIGPIVDDRLVSRSTDARARSGFRVAYLYSYSVDTVLRALAGRGPFRVYGLGAHASRGDIELLATDRDGFRRDLAACEGVILNGSFQGVCEAAALGKPILVVPFRGQYEERFNAMQVERAGLGVTSDRLTAGAVDRLLAAAPVRPIPTPTDGAAQAIAALSL